MLKRVVNTFKNKAKAWLLYVALVGVLLKIVVMPFSDTRMGELAGRLAGYLSLVAVLCCLIHSIIFDEANFKGLLMLGFICLTIGSLMVTNNVSYNNIVDIVEFLELPILLFCFDKDVRNGLLSKIFIAFLIIAGFFFVLSFDSSNYDPKFENAYTIAGANYNPNFAGLQITECAFILLCAIPFYKDVRLKAIFAGGVAVCVYLIYITLSRTCLIVCVFGILLFILQKFTKLKSGVVLAVFLVPIIMIFFLLYGESIYANLTFLGDAFDTGRKEHYEFVFSNINAIKYFFGSGKVIDDPHNAYLHVFSQIGAIGFCVYFGLMMHCILKRLQDKIKPYQTTALIGMLVLILHCSMESGLAKIGPIVSIPFFLLYLISCTEERKKLKTPKNFTSDYFEKVET